MMFRYCWAVALALLFVPLPAAAQSQCEYRSTPPTLLTGQRITPLCNVNGYLKTDPSASSGTSDVNVTKVAGVAVKTGYGTATGTQRTTIAGNASATYTVTGTGYTAYATPTDLVCIKGSGTKTIQVLAMSLRVNTTAAALQTVFWVKRSAADTGGTSTNPTAISYDSANAAATAVVDVYTVAPTLGTTVGTLAYHSAATAVLTGAPGLYLMTNNALQGNTITLTQAVTVRTAAEQLCINWNGAALPGGFTAQYDIEWIEF